MSFEKLEESYRDEGVICLSIDFPYFEFAFFANRSVTNTIRFNRVVAAKIEYPFFLFAIRVDYTNFDSLPPSIKFIDPLNSFVSKKRPLCEFVIASNFQREDSPFEGKNQNILLTNNDGDLFLCLRGIREYHEHPQHDGDSWFLHRLEGKGDVIYILDQLQLYTISNYHKMVDNHFSKNSK